MVRAQRFSLRLKKIFQCKKNHFGNNPNSLCPQISPSVSLYFKVNHNNKNFTEVLLWTELLTHQYLGLCTLIFKGSIMFLIPVSEKQKQSGVRIITRDSQTVKKDPMVPSLTLQLHTCPAPFSHSSWRGSGEIWGVRTHSSSSLPKSLFSCIHSPRRRNHSIQLHSDFPNVIQCQFY